MNDSEPSALRVAMLEAVRRVLDSGWYVLGREVESFEHEWAATCGARHAVGVANGFYPTKNLGAIDDAGIIVTNDDSVAQIATRLRNYGQSDRYHHPDVGLNSRLDAFRRHFSSSVLNGSTNLAVAARRSRWRTTLAFRTP